jgi:hypothetical protein
VTNAELGSKLPTRETLYDDPAVLKKVPVAKLGKDAIIKNSTPRPVSPYYSDVSLELSQQFNACLAGNISPIMPRRRCKRTCRRSSTRANRQQAEAGRGVPLRHAAFGGFQQSADYQQRADGRLIARCAPNFRPEIDVAPTDSSPLHRSLLY